MHLAALTLMVSAAAPGSGLAASLTGSLRLTLTAEDFSPPLYLAALAAQPADASSAAAPPAPGSKAGAFGEAYGLSLLENLAFGSIALACLAAIGGTPWTFSNAGGPVTGGGAGVLGVLGVLALIAEPFASAGSTRWIFGKHGYDVNYWEAFAGALVGEIVLGIVLGYVVGNAISSATGSALATFIGSGAAGDVAGAFGAPIVGMSLARPLSQSAPVTESAPLVRLAF